MRALPVGSALLGGLFWTHVRAYGGVRLDMDRRLEL